MANTYAVWDSSKKGANITLSGGNLVATQGSPSAVECVLSDIGVSSGKWYWEITVTTAGTQQIIGIGNVSQNVSTGFPGIDNNGYGYYNLNGFNYHTSTSAYGATWTTGDIIGIALDMDGGTITMYKNNTSQGTMFSSISGTFYAAIHVYGTGSVGTANFGATALTYSPPGGYNAGLYTSTGSTFSPRISLLGVGR